MELLIYLVIVLVSLFVILLIIGFLVHGVVYGKSKVSNETIEKFLNKTHYKCYKEEIKQGIEWFNKKEKEVVTIKSFDNLSLKGYIVFNNDIANNNKFIILVHGYHSRADFDFSVGGVDYYKMGFNLLYFDQRAHEQSEGKYTTFGIKERYDLKSWIEYLDERYNGNVEILLGGISMGASTILYTLSFELPKSVKGAICDCGYTSPMKVLNSVAKRKVPVVYGLITFFVNIASFLKTGVFLNSMNTKKCLSNVKLPILIVHGDKDHTVPVEMAKMNYSYLNSDKYLCIIEGADHGISYLVNKEEYLKNINFFVNKYF